MAYYIGYMTHNPYEAEKRYLARTGCQPTVIVARPEFVLDKSHPLVRRCNNGAASILLVTHLLNPDQIQDGKHLSLRHSIEEVENEKARTSKDNIIPKHGRGRPSAFESLCPHCGSPIERFEQLGYWYGWAIGIEPPYWEELRQYVFRRDDYSCQKCRKKLPMPDLRCHHLQPKEEGGTDSSRNLTTLCGECHVDEHPIFPEEK